MIIIILGGSQEDETIDGSASRLPLIQLVLFIIGFILCAAALIMDIIFYVKKMVWFDEHYDGSIAAVNGTVNWKHDVRLYQSFMIGLFTYFGSKLVWILIL